MEQIKDANNNAIMDDQFYLLKITDKTVRIVPLAMDDKEGIVMLKGKFVKYFLDNFYELMVDLEIYFNEKQKRELNV